MSVPKDAKPVASLSSRLIKVRLLAAEWSRAADIVDVTEVALAKITGRRVLSTRLRRDARNQCGGTDEEERCDNLNEITRFTTIEYEYCRFRLTKITERMVIVRFEEALS
jgi:hypothetical protein